MPNYTTNLNLEKPLLTEGYDIGVNNSNNDKIDMAVTDIVNGTQIVGNSDKLDGNDSTYFATTVGLSTHEANVSNPHSVDKIDVGLSNVPNIDTTNASNITTGTLPSSVLPPIAITSVTVVANETEQLALTAQEGDVAVRSDTSLNYIHNGGTAGTMLDWTQLQVPTDTVLSVNSQTGTVVLTKIDVGLSNVDNTSDANKPVSTAQQTALDSKASTNSPTLTGTPLSTTAVNGTNTTQIATTAFVQQELGAGGYGDMLKSVYDTGDNGIVDNAEKLDNHDSTYFATASELSDHEDNIAGAIIGHVKSGTDITVDASGNVSVVDDSHNHVISNVDGLQTALDGKLSTGANAVSATKLVTARTIDITGDITATAVAFDGTANIAISAVVNDDSHNHIIGNVDGLQTALNGKLSTTGKAADSDKLDGQHGSYYAKQADMTDAIEDSDVIFNTKNTALTYTSGVLTKVIEYWENGTTKRKETDLTYTTGDLTGVVTKIYNTAGTLQKTVTETLSYTSGNLTSVARGIS